MPPRAAPVAEPEASSITIPPSLARQFRRLADYTQADLARHADIPYTKYVSFEHSRTHLDSGEQQRLFAALIPRLMPALALLATVIEYVRERVGDHDGA